MWGFFLPVFLLLLKKKQQQQIMGQQRGSSHLWFVRTRVDEHSYVDDYQWFHLVTLSPHLALFSLWNFCIGRHTKKTNRERERKRNWNMKRKLIVFLWNSIYRKTCKNDSNFGSKQNIPPMMSVVSDSWKRTQESK